MSVKPIRDGFHTVTPYLFTEDSARLIRFLCEAFDGAVTNRKDRPDGAIMHAEMRIGDSMVMAGQPDQREPGSKPPPRGFHPRVPAVCT